MLEISNEILNNMTDSEKSVITYITKNPEQAADRSSCGPRRCAGHFYCL